ncbi:hypothetical protein [Novosphingobium sp. B 225]|uniref:hypothetical protein n=1 Tax=Novosphingobium sp. B 225 TaxID=1961849 RepID=UPI000B4BD365|nr:hypothetical protein [Novosphingobium sp. B 225]
MNGDRTSQALARIDAALARLDGAARQVAENRHGLADLAQLQAKHARLRDAVSEGLQQLDQLIEGSAG